MSSSNQGQRLHGSQAQKDQGILPTQVVHWPPPAELAGSNEPADSSADRRLYGAVIHVAAEPPTPVEEMPIRLLIADDHAIVRDGIVALLESQPDIHLVGEAADGREAIRMVRQLSPDVVLMDLRMPVMDGLQATRRILAGDSHTRVLMLSQYDDEPNVTACREAGASGFIPKTTAGPYLVDGIRSVSRGVHYTPPTKIGAV